MRKPGPSPEIPPPLELQCLKALWTLGQGNVKDVREILTQNRKLAYTTVMTVLDRLEKRGRVERNKQGRRFVYSPTVSRDTLRRLAVDALVADFFDGSEGTLVEYLESVQGTKPAMVERDKQGSGGSTLDPALL